MRRTSKSMAGMANGISAPILTTAIPWVRLPIRNARSTRPSKLVDTVAELAPRSQRPWECRNPPRPLEMLD